MGLKHTSLAALTLGVTVWFGLSAAAANPFEPQSASPELQQLVDRLIYLEERVEEQENRSYELQFHGRDSSRLEADSEDPRGPARYDFIGRVNGHYLLRITRGDTVHNRILTFEECLRVQTQFDNFERIDADMAKSLCPKS